MREKLGKPYPQRPRDRNRESEVAGEADTTTNVVKIRDLRQRKA